MDKKKVNLRNDIITIFSDYINWKHSKYRMSEKKKQLDWITLKEWVDERGTKSMKNSIEKLNLPITQGAENDRNTAQRERPNEKTDINEKTRCKIRNITGTSSFVMPQQTDGSSSERRRVLKVIITPVQSQRVIKNDAAAIKLMPTQKASKHVILAEASVPLSAQNNEQTQNNEQQLIPGAYTDTIVEEGGNANTATVGLMPMQKASKHVIPAEASVPLLAQNNEQTQNNEQQLIPGACTDTIVEEGGNANTATVGLMPMQKASKHVIPAEASVPLSAQNNEQTQNNEQQLIPGAYTDTIVEEGGNANTATVGLMPMQKASKHVIPAEASVPLLAQNNEQTQNNEQQLISGACTDTIVEEGGNANTATVGLMPMQKASKHVIPAEASVPLLAQNNEQTQNNEQQLIPGAYTDTIVEESGNANTATVGLMPTQQTSNIEQVEVMPRDLITDRVPRARALARARLRRHPYIHINRCLSVFRNFLLHR
ncbi:hypothetical protein ACS0PU_009989 [Formica fusca]